MRARYKITGSKPHLPARQEYAWRKGSPTPKNISNLKLITGTGLGWCGWESVRGGAAAAWVRAWVTILRGVTVSATVTIGSIPGGEITIWVGGATGSRVESWSPVIARWGPTGSWTTFCTKWTRICYQNLEKQGKVPWRIHACGYVYVHAKLAYLWCAITTILYHFG